MGSIGNPIITGLVQAAQAQQVASRDRDRARASESAAKERLDKLDLRVDETEAPEAAREIRDGDEHEPPPQRDRDEAETDDASAEPGEDEDRPRLDLQA